MKFLIMGVPIILSIILGFLPGGVERSKTSRLGFRILPQAIIRPKPTWWRFLAMASLVVVVIVTFTIPTGGSFGGADMVRVARGEDAAVPVLMKINSIEGDHIGVTDRNGREEQIDITTINSEEKTDLKQGEEVILEIRKEGIGLSANRVLWINPPVTFPLIPALEERARNLFFHVPSAWISQLAWFIAVLFAFRYLKTRKIQDDGIASAAVAVGLLFCVLATVTGSIWAKFNWNSFWNWDPRQISIVIILIVYGSYFALRSAIQSVEQRARISAIYLLLLALPVLFFLFVYPRITSGLHPGAKGSGSLGPVVDPEDIWLNVIMQFVFPLSFFAFTLLYFWMVNLTARLQRVQIGAGLKKNEEIRAERPRSTEAIAP